MEEGRIGFAFCGSYCTYSRAMDALEEVAARWSQVIPIVSEGGTVTDTRFGEAHEWMMEMERICGRRPIASIKEAEPIGPKKLLDALVICPCTGNTLGKLANGIADTSVTMAAKSHLRNGRPVILAVSTNDGLSGSGENIGKLLNRRDFYFVPFRQDDPAGKPRSLVADFDLTVQTLASALKGEQLQPIVLGPMGAGS